MVIGCLESGAGSHLSLGSKADRGIISWREEPEDDGSLDEMINDVYGAPFVRGQGSADRNRPFLCLYLQEAYRGVHIRLIH